MGPGRLQNLDYLRGLAALGIMAYHFTLWGLGDPQADSLIKKVGLYGVSVFYVLSGLTLYHVYHTRTTWGITNLRDFFLKRCFRLMPLLWVVTLLTLFLKYWPGWVTVVLNFTGLFGLLAPSRYIGTGVWSIGNELVFYLFFPVFLLLFQRHRWGLALLGVLLFGCYCYFAFWRLPALGTMPAAWTTYINPLNQVFLFLCGFLVGGFFQNRKFRNGPLLAMLLLAVLVFVLYPVSGDVLQLVTGHRRLLYTAICVVICLSAYKISFQAPAVIDRPLRLLGEISYSLYLLHPIVWVVITRLSDRYFPVPLLLQMAVCALVSGVASYISYQYFERYFVRKGKQISAHWAAKPSVAFVA